MIRLKEFEHERGGSITVVMTPFDLASLMADIMTAVAHMEDGKEKEPRAWEVLGLEGRLKDARADYEELRWIQVERNAVIDSLPYGAIAGLPKEP